jgi:hypothetical protein
MNIEGYFLSAIGTEHILMAHYFSITLKMNGDMRPVCVLVKPEHVGFARDLELFDHIIVYEETPEYAKLTDHERWCGMAKMDFHNKIPFDKYIMIDTDFLVVGQTPHVWDLLRTQNVPVVNFGVIDAPYWHWDHLPEIEKRTNLKLSYTCGDIVFFNKLHPDFHDYIARIKDIFLNKYDEYGCRRAFGAKRSMTEEITFSIASAERGYKPIQMHEFPVINYNPKPGQSYKQFMFPFEPITDKNTLFNIRPPFVHLWDKYYGLNYQRVFMEVITRLIDQGVTIPIPMPPVQSPGTA